VSFIVDRPIAIFPAHENGPVHLFDDKPVLPVSRSGGGVKNVEYYLGDVVGQALGSNRFTAANFFETGNTY
jgi:hypothetical protein